MKSKEEIELKAREMIRQKLQERKKLLLSRLSSNCQSHQKVRIKNNGCVNICAHKDKMVLLAEDRLFLCDDEVASNCPLWNCKNTEETVEREFNEILKSPARCGNAYPKLAVLIWVLQGGDNSPEIPCHESPLNRLKKKLKSLIFAGIASLCSMLALIRKK